MKNEKDLDGRTPNRISRITGVGVVFLAAGMAGGISFACVGKDPDPRIKTCDISTPFQQVKRVLGSYAAGDPSLTSDEKTITFWMKDSTNLPHLYMATRTSTSDDFGLPQLVDGLYNAAWSDSEGQLSLLGDTLVFASDRPDTTTDPDGGCSKIFRAQRNGTAYTVEPNAIYSEANTEYRWYDSHPFLTSGGELFFFSWHSSQSRIFRSVADTNGHFPAAVAIPAYHDATNQVSDGVPVLSRDGLIMYFSSTYPYQQTSDIDSPFHIFVMSRATVNDQFGTPDSVIGIRERLPSSIEEDPGWLSDDNCRLYFTSYTSDSPDPALYVASR
ncbi:MAG: hypothetical protein FWD69_13690 [Polyangiaceae bacterium]|nr:hypothetical protein [Polyangiaceae bacterium]